MKNRILATTDSYSWFILRVTLGFVMLGHGVQKAFGWFGGYGWDNTIGYFRGTVGMPSWLGALVILIESLGALLLIVGFAGRINAALTGVVMIGAFFVDHLPNGFFMNWFGTNKGEGYEFDILFWAIAVVITMNGSGRCSIDRWLTTRKRAGALHRSPHLPYKYIQYRSAIKEKGLAASVQQDLLNSFNKSYRIAKPR